MPTIVADIKKQLREINIVSFSGGKDSSATLQNVFRALGDSGKRLYIITSDTLMEIPYYQNYLNRTKERIKTYIRQSGLNAEMITVRPDIKNSFWVSVLGLGYPAAHMGFRWCTGKLKIDPIGNFVKRITADRDFMVFVGVRSAESALRARIYKEKNYKPHHYAPILDWTAHDVWEFLLTQPCPWGDHSELIQVYRYSSDECVYGEKQGVCVGNARYGCWACPLQKSTQLEMIGFHTNDQKRYRALKDYKEILVTTANTSAYRSRIRRNGSEGCGPFLVSIRKKLFAKLKETEEVTGWQLITPEETAHIKYHWETDKDIHNIPDATQPMLFC